MLSSSSTQRRKMSSAHLVHRRYGYAPLKTCSIPSTELEVLYESMVDFENLREHEFNTNVARSSQKKPPPSEPHNSFIIPNSFQSPPSTLIFNPQPLNAFPPTPSDIPSSSTFTT